MIKIAIRIIFLLLISSPLQAATTVQKQRALRSQNIILQRNDQFDQRLEIKRHLEEIHEEKSAGPFKAQDHLKGHVAYDNSGSKITGSRLETIGLEYDGLFDKDDSFTINNTSNQLRRGREDRGGYNDFSTIWQTPIKNYKLTLTYDKSNYFFWEGKK